MGLVSGDVLDVFLKRLEPSGRRGGRKRKSPPLIKWRAMVGVPGFEPGTPWSQTRCATGLRYTPINIFVVSCG